MKYQVIGAMAACLALTACGSKPKEEATPAVAVTQEAPGVVPSGVGTSVPASAMKAAPEGLPSRVAREVLGAAGLPCAAVTKADRSTSDGTITATCSGGESYRVFTEEGKGPAATAL